MPCIIAVITPLEHNQNTYSFNYLYLLMPIHSAQKLYNDNKIIERASIAELKLEMQNSQRLTGGFLLIKPIKLKKN